MPPTAPGNQPAPESPPKWYVNLVKRHPQLEGLWDDPLLEHARATLPPNRLVYWEGPVGAVMALFAYWIYTRIPGIVGNGMPGAGVLLFPPLLTCAAGYMGSRVPRNPLKWLRTPASEEWHTFPMDPGRAARLVAFAELLGTARIRRKDIAYYVQSSILGSVIAAILLLRLELIPLLLPAIGIVAAMRFRGSRHGVAALIPEYDMVREAVTRLESFAQRMKISPLSQDSSALSIEKKLMYGTFSYEIKFPVTDHPLSASVIEIVELWDTALRDALSAFESCYTRWVKSGLEAKEG